MFFLKTVSDPGDKEGLALLRFCKWIKIVYIDLMFLKVFGCIPEVSFSFMRYMFVTSKSNPLR